MEQHVLAMRPSPTGDGRTVASFDIEVGPFRFFGLLLRRYHDGNFRTFSPNANGRHAVTFHPEIAKQITPAAVGSLYAVTSKNRRAS